MKTKGIGIYYDNKEKEALTAEQAAAKEAKRREKKAQRKAAREEAESTRAAIDAAVAPWTDVTVEILDDLKGLLTAHNHRAATGPNDNAPSV